MLDEFRAVTRKQLLKMAEVTAGKHHARDAWYRPDLYLKGLNKVLAYRDASTDRSYIEMEGDEFSFLSLLVREAM